MRPLAIGENFIRYCDHGFPLDSLTDTYLDRFSASTMRLAEKLFSDAENERTRTRSPIHPDDSRG